MDSTNYSLADLSAAMGGNGGMNNWMNNPFMYLIWLAYLGGNGFGFGGKTAAADATQNAEVMSQLSAIRTQMSDNQSTNALTSAISSNHDYLHDLSASTGLGFAGVTSGINQASMTNLIGQKDAAAQQAACCCDIKSNILSQTNQLQSRIDQLANGVAQGFAQVGFLTQQQTNELNQNNTANTQRIIDQLNSATTQELRDKLWEASQTAQTATIISSLKTSSTTTA